MKNLARGVTAQRGVWTAITSGLQSGRLVLSPLNVLPVAARTRIGIKQARIKGKESSMSEALRLADALEDTPNWQKESFGSDWKSSTMKFDRTPFEAAAELRRLHAENEALLSETRTLVRQNGQWQELNSELVEALRCADAMLSGANMDEKAVERKVSAALAKVEASK